jgi:hypothetical protein
MSKDIEEIARAISIPEHHTGWELLSETQRDLYRMQAGYAYSVMEKRLGEAYDEGVEDGIGWHCFPESGPRPQWMRSALNNESKPGENG